MASMCAQCTVRQYCKCHWWQYNYGVVLSHLPQYMTNASSVGSRCIINDMASMCAQCTVRQYCICLLVAVQLLCCIVSFATVHDSCLFHWLQIQVHAVTRNATMQYSILLRLSNASRIKLAVGFILVEQFRILKASKFAGFSILESQVCRRSSQDMHEKR